MTTDEKYTLLANFFSNNRSVSYPHIEKQLALLDDYEKYCNKYSKRMNFFDTQTAASKKIIKQVMSKDYQ